MEYSDNEKSGDEAVDNVLEPEDLFSDEAEEDNAHRDGDEKDITNGDKPEDSKQSSEKVEKTPKPKRVVKNPRVKLNFDTLRGPNGLSALKKLFTDFKFKGNNHEEEDLTRILAILQHWMCYQLCPSYDFETCMLQLEALGKKKIIQTLLKKYRLGMDDWGERKSDNEDNMDVADDNPNKERDEFDAWLQQEIANARSDDEFSENEVVGNSNGISESQKEPEITLTQEQLERIARNRKLAEERRLKRMSTQQEQMDVTECSVNDSEIPIEKITLD